MSRLQPTRISPMRTNAPRRRKSSSNIMGSSSKARKQLNSAEQAFATYKQFIRQNFRYRECCYYCPKNPDDIVCQCGETFENHHQKAMDNMRDNKYKGDKWKLDVHAQKIGASNAFGQIQFLTERSGSQKLTEYVRISYDDDMDKVIELMTKSWGWELYKNEHPPSLCISVIGGAKNFKMEGRKREIFHNGLIKAAHTTNAWLLTSGLNLGVIRVVGDALKHGHVYHFDKKRMTDPLNCIGIAPWGYVLDRKKLENTDGEGSFPALYKVSNVIESGKPVSLNENHTHYIFVDEGLRNKYGGCKSAEFRAELEKKIATSRSDNGLGIPVVLVVVEGGHDVFIDCSNSIKQRVPVVICDGTGRASDILAFVIKKINLQDDRSQLNSLKDREELRHLVSKVSDKRTDEALKLIMEIVQDDTLLTVFDMNKAEELDKAILYALIKSQEDRMTASEASGGRKKEEDKELVKEILKLQQKKQISLALTWNRSDIADEKIFTDKVNWTTEDLQEFMIKALKEDKVDFVRLILHNGLVMQEFLTYSILKDLYRYSIKNNIFFREIFLSIVTPGRRQERNNTDNIYLADVKILIQLLIGSYKDDDMDSDTRNSKTHNTNRCQNPFKDLFLWSVLNGRQPMAVFFWERSDDAIPLALIATQMYRAMKKAFPSYDTENKDMCQIYKDEFEDYATSVLEECSHIDPKITTYIIKTDYPEWNGRNCLDISADSDDMKFLGSTMCQNALDLAWCKSLTTHYFFVVFSLLFPFLIVSDRIVTMRCEHEQEVAVANDPHDMVAHHTHPRHEHSDKRSSYLMTKYKKFYTAPKTKFVVNLIAYLIFLCLYSYFLLFGMKKDEITTLEMFIFIYFFAFLVDEIRELGNSRANSVTEKFRNWWRFSHWNRLDLAMIIFSLVGCFLRIGKANTAIHAKTFYTILGVCFFIRVFRLYSVHPKLGPKLVMISRMVGELIFYVLILAIPLLAYGVTHQALLFPWRDYSDFALLQVFYYPFWQLFGEIYLQEATGLGGVEGCTDESVTNTIGEYCPKEHFMVPLLLVFYLLIGNVLLLNLLIAIFSHVFQEVNENSHLLWKFKMYSLVKEYKHKPYLPIPLLIIEDFIRLFVYIHSVCCTKHDPSQDEANRLPKIAVTNDDPEGTHTQELTLELNEDQASIIITNLAIREVVRRKKMQKITTTDFQLKYMKSQVEELDKKFDDQRHTLDNMRSTLTHISETRSSDSRPSSAAETLYTSGGKERLQILTKEAADSNKLDQDSTRLRGKADKPKAISFDDSLNASSSGMMPKNVSDIPAWVQQQKEINNVSFSRQDTAISLPDSDDRQHEIHQHIKITTDEFDHRIQTLETRFNDLNDIAEQLRSGHVQMPLPFHPPPAPPPSSQKEFSKKKMKLIESRLGHLEESTTQSLANIERLLRVVLQGHSAGVVNLEDSNAPGSSRKSRTKNSSEDIHRDPEC